MRALVLRRVNKVLAAIGQQTARYLSKERKVMWRMVQKVTHSERNIVSLQTRSPKGQDVGLQSWERHNGYITITTSLALNKRHLMTTHTRHAHVLHRHSEHTHVTQQSGSRDCTVSPL